MCGFVGIFNKNGKKEDKTIVTEMMDRIVHRGPDDSGYFIEEGIALGFRRLSIIDLEGGHQPLMYENGRYVIVFNGEVYNYKELRETLISEGMKFATSSDTEVILASYAKYGEECLQKLRGMFTFLIWDREKKVLFGARDHFGIKPLYYYETHNKIYFASEAKSILLMVERNRVNNRSTQQYFTYQYVPEPLNLNEGFKKFEAGHCFTLKDNQLIVKRYWEAVFAKPGNSTGPMSDCCKEIRDVMDDSVRKHMRSDVPVGAFLSGGIDSTITATLAKKYKQDLLTFTVGFKNEGYSEGDVARETARKLNVENIYVEISPEDYMNELPKIVWHMDDPLADPACVPLYFVAREAAKHVTVVLSGEGADELFGGYTIYNEPNGLRIFNYFPKGVKKILKDSTSSIRSMKGINFIQRGCTELEDRYYGNARIFKEEEKKQFLKNYDSSIHYTDITKPIYDRTAGYDSVAKMQCIDIETWLKGDILLKADKMTMAHSLELRVPFLDVEVFKVASQIPKDFKVDGVRTKMALREAFKDIIPEHVVNRKKLGFPVPIRVWLKNEMYEWALDIIKRSGTDYIINKNVVLDMLEAHKNGVVDNSRKIWMVIIYMLWHEMFIENKIHEFAKKSK